MTKAELYPTAKHLRDAIIYFMKETDRLNEVEDLKRRLTNLESYNEKE